MMEVEREREKQVAIKTEKERDRHIENVRGEVEIKESDEQGLKHSNWKLTLCQRFQSNHFPNPRHLLGTLSSSLSLLFSYSLSPFSVPNPTEPKMTSAMAPAGTRTFITITFTHMCTHMTHTIAHMHTISHAHNLTHIQPPTHNFTHNHSPVSHTQSHTHPHTPLIHSTDEQTLRRGLRKASLDGRVWGWSPPTASSLHLLSGALATLPYSFFHHHLLFSLPQVATSHFPASTTDTVPREKTNIWRN